MKITRKDLIAAIDRAAADSNITGEHAERLRAVGREADDLGVGTFTSLHGRRCPLSLCGLTDDDGTPLCGLTDQQVLGFALIFDERTTEASDRRGSIFQLEVED